MVDEKFPWESLTELTAFVGVCASLVASFGYSALTPEQVGGISTILFVLVMLARKYGSGGDIVLSKSKPPEGQ
jgi:hypothetical protein